MMLQLPTGLHVFERGWLSSNCILFESAEGSWLIDSGYCTHSDQTLELIESRIGTRRLDYLINTHLHSDHCGGNAALQAKYTNLLTSIAPGQALSVQQWDSVSLFYTPTGQCCPQFSFSNTLEAGSIIQLGNQKWEVHAAGGHDPHSVIFFEPNEKILISADALWENGFGVIFPELEGVQAFNDVAATLDLIEKLNPKIVIPGHGPVFNYSPEILAVAHKKLEGFRADPIKLARHAAKVLLKFKLLELQRVLFSDLFQWALTTYCLRHYQKEYFNELKFSSWFGALCAELVKANVARREGYYIVNC